MLTNSERLLLLLILAGGAATSACARQPEAQALGPESYCDPARDFFSNTLGVLAVVDPDTIQDWRTDTIVMGCRVYAADASNLDMSGAARTFYEKLTAAGWTRTPNPQDMPNEAALRLRMNNVDCLYHVYRAPLINTSAEAEVTRSVVLQPGQIRYNLLVQCMPAVDAAPA